MAKLSTILERAIVNALNTAAGLVAADMLSDGIKTIDVTTQLIQESLVEASSAISAQGAKYLELENLKLLENKKANWGTFLGMIKGKCVTGGMRARDVYDLNNLLKSMSPKEAFQITTEGCMELLGNTLASLGTKIASSISSYVAPAGFTKLQVIEAFAKEEANLIETIMANVKVATEAVLYELGQSPSGNPN